MESGAETIRKELENTYDIPFVVTQDQTNGEPCFCMGPEDKEKLYFYIRVSFSNKIRIILEFIPNTFGEAFVQSMGRHPEEDRENFLRFYDIIIGRGAKIQISVNHEELKRETFKKCSVQWNYLEIRITKSPVSDESNFSYSKSAMEWGSLMMGMILSLADIIPLEDDETAGLNGAVEGAKSQVLRNKYERNPINRKLCLEKKGYTCCICGMNFENVYGKIGHNFIHVHHIVPVSQIGEGYVIDPERDLVPVCPNCHAMLHKKDPPYTPEELKLILQEQ